MVGWAHHTVVASNEVQGSQITKSDLSVGTIGNKISLRARILVTFVYAILGSTSGRPGSL